MANQSMVSISANQDDICNWELVNHFDVEIDSVVVIDDDESVYDLVESIHSLSSTSSSDDEEEEDAGGEENQGPTIVHHDVDDGGVNVNVDCSRVSVSGENLENLDGEVGNCGGNRDKNDGFVEYFNGSSLVLHGHDDRHVDYDDDGGGENDDDDGDDDGYGMDDELVPWEVKDRLMRQRIRKSGKNSIGRLAKSKKSALVFTRPGCVRGKHGLGLKVY